MHPAPSVILFTTLSGLGFGLLVWLGFGKPEVTGWMAFFFFVLAYLLAVGGLAASTFHLGHPERALKAFTQWRSSWLSREAWCAVGALVIMGIYGLGLVFFGQRWGFFGILGALLSLATVFTTSMIYTQLKTVPRWNMPLTPIMFLTFSIAGGALLAGELWWGGWLLVLVGIVQITVWVMGDTALSMTSSDTGTATGLGSRGTVRAFEPPHTGTNYLLKEFVHVVGRKHSLQLRVISLVLMVILPGLLLVLLPFSHFAAAIAILMHVAGVLASRWLFFAEAEHVVGLYYGKR